MRDTNCPNCGAPITGDHCEYCGTVFVDVQELIRENQVRENQVRLNELYMDTIKAMRNYTYTPNEARELLGLTPI